MLGSNVLVVVVAEGHIVFVICCECGKRHVDVGVISGVWVCGLW